MLGFHICLQLLKELPGLSGIDQDGGDVMIREDFDVKSITKVMASYFGDN